MGTGVRLDTPFGPVRVAIMVAEHMVLQMLALAKHLNEVAAIANEAGLEGRYIGRIDIRDEAVRAVAVRDNKAAVDVVLGFPNQGSVALLERRLRACAELFRRMVADDAGEVRARSRRRGRGRCCRR